MYCSALYRLDMLKFAGVPPRGIYPLGSWSKILAAAGPSPPFPYPSRPLSFSSALPLEAQTLQSLPTPPFPSLPCKQGSGVSPWKIFLKSRWMWVKFDALLGKIWPLNRRTVSGADSLKIGIFWNYRPIWLCCLRKRINLVATDGYWLIKVKDNIIWQIFF